MSNVGPSARWRASLPGERHQMQGDGGLGSVLAEVRELLHGVGAFLMMLPSDGKPEMVYQDSGAAEFSKEELLRINHAAEADIEDGAVSWRMGPSESSSALLLLPVERAGNHSRLVIGVLLDRPDDDVRLNAERVYRERRPFAVGYFHLWQRSRLMEQRAASFEAILDQAAIGVLLLDRSATVTYTNEAAREMLVRGDGLVLGKGRLRATRPSDAVNLQAALSHILGIHLAAPSRSLKHPLIAFGRKSAQPLVAALVPSANLLLEPTAVAATMYLVDPDRNISSMLAPVCKLYRLSPVETRLACLLTTGATITDAATTIQVKESTARSYLKSIFAKTTTARQSELIVLLLSSVIHVQSLGAFEAMTTNGADA